MTGTIDLERLHIDHGSHTGPDVGHCLLEVVSMLANEPFSESPKCVSPYLRRFGIRLNDLASDAQRQDLKRFIPLLVGTAGDGLDGQRRWLGADHAIRTSTPRWLDRAGLTDHAERLRALAPVTDQSTYNTARAAVTAARDAAYQLRSTVYGGKSRWGFIRDAVTAKLAETQPAVADAVADAAADADADADAVAVADAAAAATATAAAAVADAAADAATAAATDAVAVAVAAAVATAATAAAVADAAAATAATAADATAQGYRGVWDAVYERVLPIFKERYASIYGESWQDALDLFDRLIDPTKEAAA